MIAPDTQRFSRQLGRHMAIAQVPGDAGEMQVIGAANFKKLLRRGDDLDQTSVFQCKSVAAAQCGGIWQVEQER
jgi:hypothetical protein